MKIFHQHVSQSFLVKLNEKKKCSIYIIGKCHAFKVNALQQNTHLYIICAMTFMKSIQKYDVLVF